MAGTAPDIPDRFARHLIRSERIVAAVRRHPVQVLEPVLSAVAALLVVLWLQSRLSPDVAVVPDVLWMLWLGVLLRALWRLYEWSQDWFVVTNHRIMLNYGVLTRRVAMMPMKKVTDMSYNRSVPGRVLGYGEFVLESAGQDQALSVVSWLPSPDLLYRLISAEIYGNAGDVADVEVELPPVEDPRGPAVVLPPQPREPHGWSGFRLGPDGGQPEVLARSYETDVLQVGDPAGAEHVDLDDDWADGSRDDEADDGDEAAWDVLGWERDDEDGDDGPEAAEFRPWRDRLDPRSWRPRGWRPRGWRPRSWDPRSWGWRRWDPRNRK